MKTSIWILHLALELIVEKDINEMVLNGGFSPDEIQDFISKSTFVNLRAKMEFINWKKR